MTAGLVLLIGFQAAVFVAVRVLGLPRSYFMATSGIFFLWFPVMLFATRGRASLHRSLKEHGGHLCPRCEHPLPPGTGGVRTCAECGLSEPEESHIAYWKRWSQL